jgi:hypothetical protein
MGGAQAAPAGEVVAEKLCPHSSFEFLDLIYAVVQIFLKRLGSTISTP